MWPISQSPGWRHPNEIDPKRFRTSWPENAIVITYNCCKTPVIIGEITGDDKARGFVRISFIPSRCPSGCYYVRGHYSASSSSTFDHRVHREPKKLIHPVTTHPNPIEYRYEESRPGCEYNMVIYLDSYYTAPFIEEQEELPSKPIDTDDF